ncbi:hypothetical protein E6H27_04735 [Candidatus Bathyarchaeota archaeon]|nr:MAG: hypothetical protein E6H27_04735 [Candidatus Bathyarchaeota archaeon]
MKNEQIHPELHANSTAITPQRMVNTKKPGRNKNKGSVTHRENRVRRLPEPDPREIRQTTRRGVV